MILISQVRIPRIEANLHELSAHDVGVLCLIDSENSAQRGTGELLDRVLDAPPEKPKVDQVIDHRLWTIQERAFVVAHYLAAIIEPNFQVGDRGRYEHYLQPSLSASAAQIDLGQLGDDYWHMQPLLGFHAEAIERLILAEELPSNRAGWMIGAMACQLYTPEQGQIVYEDQMLNDIDAAVAARTEAIMKLPESDFLRLVHAFTAGLDELSHIFLMTITDQGYAWLPVSQEVPDLPPARFSFALAYSPITAGIFGQFVRAEDGDGDLLESADAGDGADDPE